MQFITKSEKPRIGGYFKIETSDGQVGKCKNIIPNVAIQHLGDILVNVETSLVDLTHMEVGTGTTDPALTDTDTETPATGTNSGRRTITSRTRSGTSPYEVVLSYFIASGDLDRDISITEITVFWGGTSEDIFARGELDTPITLTTGTTATVSYGIVFL
jgi:hypothetical protein